MILAKVVSQGSRGRSVSLTVSGLLLGSLLWVGGCSTTGAREAADKATYNIIAEKSPAVPGMVPEFSVEQDQSVEPLSGLPVQDTADEALGEAAQAEVGASVISLERALELAFTRNRTYQNQKEALYLEALGLTLGRHQYDPIFAAGGGVNSVSSVTEETVASDFSRHLGNARQIAQGIEMVTGTPAALLNAYADVVEQAGVVANVDATKVDLNREHDASGNVTGGVDLLLKGGGRIALALTSNFFRFLTGDPRTATASILSATFTQPLLRGAGADIAAEQLTQAERNVLYRIRDFTRFRQEFAVQVCSNYYSVLQDRDIVENAWRSYQNFEKSVERERAFAEEGRHTLADLGRIEQAQLSNETSWINAIRRYKESMDQFKILLGLSTDAHVMLDKAELEQLHQEGLQHPKIPVEDAIEVALASRLDFENTKGVTEDTVRQMKVAKNALKADVNLVLSSQVHSTGEDNFQSLDFDRAEFGGGLDIDLPIERMAERNNYRAALIAHERAIRDESLATDNVKFDVRAAWRNLDQALRNYQTAQRSVDLNQRRVEEQELRADLGRALAIDQVDAQNALTGAQNDLTAALVNHTIARLEFWRDMGILYIKKDGQWEEVKDGFVVLPAAEKVQEQVKPGLDAPSTTPGAPGDDDPALGTGQDAPAPEAGTPGNS